MEDLIQQLDPNAGTVAFLKVMGAMLVANLLTVGFVWAAWNYSRLEREGRERSRGSGIYLFLFALPFAMVLLAFIAG